MVNVFGSTGSVISVATTQLCYYRIKAAVDSTWKDEWPYPHKTLWMDTALWIS